MIVVDASVVITCLLPEAESDAARTLIASEFCVAPDLLVSECVNAFWKNVRLGRILRSEAEMALDGRFNREEAEALEEMGLGLDADRAGLRRRYSELVRQYHPDRNGGDRKFEARLGRVVEAYQLLRKSSAIA